MTTFVLRRYLTVPRSRQCLRYGHESCAANVSFFRCGSTDHIARDCKQKELICVPCKQDGFSHNHNSRDKKSCASYQMYIKNYKNERQEKSQYKALGDTAREAKMPRDHSYATVSKMDSRHNKYQEQMTPKISQEKTV